MPVFIVKKSLHPHSHTQEPRHKIEYRHPPKYCIWYSLSKIFTQNINTACCRGLPIFLTIFPVCRRRGGAGGWGWLGGGKGTVYRHNPDPTRKSKSSEVTNKRISFTKEIGQDLLKNHTYFVFLLVLFLKMSWQVLQNKLYFFWQILWYSPLRISSQCYFKLYGLFLFNLF